MSNIFQSKSIESDLDDFLKAIFETNKYQFKIEDTKGHVKKYHRHTYVIALIETKLETLHAGTHRYIFLNEMLSDLLSVISLAFLGFYQPAEIITRRIIENFYNHIFYYDHKIEFQLLNSGKNDYLPMSDLKNYLSSHPVFKSIDDSNVKIYNDEIFRHYQELCKFVHSKGEGFMGLAKNLEDTKTDFDIKLLLQQIVTSLQGAIYLLYKFHDEIEYTRVELDLIAKTFNKNIRGSLLS